jgi:hypothetical protein
MPRNPDEYSLLKKVRWSRFAKSEACTIIMNAGPRNTQSITPLNRLHRGTEVNITHEIYKLESSRDALRRYYSGTNRLQTLATVMIATFRCVSWRVPHFL